MKGFIKILAVEDLSSQLETLLRLYSLDYCAISEVIRVYMWIILHLLEQPPSFWHFVISHTCID